MIIDYFIIIITHIFYHECVFNSDNRSINASFELIMLNYAFEKLFYCFVFCSFLHTFRCTATRFLKLKYSLV